MRIAMYARVSLDEQHGQDISLQTNAIREYCTKNNHILAKEFIDRESGQSMQRPEFRRMLLCAKNKDFDAIIVWKLDRLARLKPSESLFILDKIKKMEIKLISLMEEWFSLDNINEPTINLHCYIIFWKAWAEAEDVKKRVRAGIKNKQAKKEYKGGRPKGVKDKTKRIRRWKTKPDTQIEDLF